MHLTWLGKMQTWKSQRIQKERWVIIVRLNIIVALQTRDQLFRPPQQLNILSAYD